MPSSCNFSNTIYNIDGRLIFTLDADDVVEKAKETPLQLEGNTLTVSSVFVPTHDQSILLAKNLNPKTTKETLENFVESTKNVEVFNVILGKDGNAIVILKSAIGGFLLLVLILTIFEAANFRVLISPPNIMFYLDADEDNSEKECPGMKLDGSIISLEFAPLTNGIKISNIPQDTNSDDIKFKFLNPKIGGGKVTDMMFDRSNGVAIVYFDKSSGRNMQQIF